MMSDSATKYRVLTVMEIGLESEFVHFKGDEYPRRYIFST